MYRFRFFLFCMASSAFWCPVLYIYSFSFVLYSNRAEEILKKVFKKNVMEQGIFLEGVVSRKKQILPGIMFEMGEQ